MYHFKRDFLLNVLKVPIATKYSGEIICADMKRVCGFAVSHIVTHYYAASHRVAWSVGLTVCQSVTLVSPEKTAEAIKLPFALRTPVGPMNV